MKKKDIKTCVAITLGIFITVVSFGWWIYTGQINCQIASEAVSPLQHDFGFSDE